jgi:hypothetical protein
VDVVCFFGAGQNGGELHPNRFCQIVSWALTRFALQFPHDGIPFENTAGGRHGVHDVGAAMSRFGYLRDPLLLVAGAGYVLNRWLLKPLLPSPFLH